MNSYEEFLQAITELYDQNKLDFNNYKILKKELESIENEHEQQKSEYRSYFKMLESKIKNLVVSGGGLTENQVQNIVSNYVTSHKSELTGARGPQGPQGPQGPTGPQGPAGSGLTTTQEQQIATAYNHSQSAHAPVNAEQNVQSNWNETNTSSDAYILNKPTLSTVATSGSYNDLINKPSTITISFNGNTYTPNSNGVIILPNIESSGGSGSTGSIDTSNFVTFNNSYVRDCNSHYVNGYIKTNTSTLNLPNACDTSSKWGILFCILENSTNGTGTQIYFPVDGNYKGRVFTRSVKNLKLPNSQNSAWGLLQIDTSVSDEPIEGPGEMSKGGVTSE